MIIIIDKTIKYSNFSKEFVLCLINFAQMLGAQSIILFIHKENDDYIKLLQGIITVGFLPEEKLKIATIGDKCFTLFRMKLKNNQNSIIQDINFI